MPSVTGDRFPVFLIDWKYCTANLRLEVYTHGTTKGGAGVTRVGAKVPNLGCGKSADCCRRSMPRAYSKGSWEA